MRQFLDTNVLVYAFSFDQRVTRARALLEEGGIVGVQSLNEFVNVALNKLKLDWPDVVDAVSQIRILCHVAVPVDLELHEAGLAISGRYRIRIFDSLILAAALRADCETLWSEDMQDGLVVDGRLTIRNPFAYSRIYPV